LLQRNRDNIWAIKEIKLQITIDVDESPSEEELSMLGFNTELEYWIDLIYSDPPLVLDGARFELVEYDL